MTEEEALKTCTGFVNYPNLKGYFTFQAAQMLVSTGKYAYHQATTWGYVLTRLSEEQRAISARRREKERYGGALDWLSK